jgi:hypothetical protein
MPSSASPPPFIERAAMAGDELGAHVILARLVRDAMRLAFLLERRYAPYSKWLGSAFATLPVAGELLPRLSAALDDPVDGGQSALCDALVILGSVTNARVGTSVDPSPHRYFNRPMQVAPAGAFVDAVFATVSDARLRSLPTSVGNVDMLFGTNNGSFPGAREAYLSLLNAR